MFASTHNRVLFDKHRTLIRAGVWSFVVLAVLMLVPLMVVIDSHKPELESQLSAAFHRQVTIGSLRISVFPRLRLVARDVRIRGEANEGDAVANAVYIGVDMGSLTSDKVLIHYIHVDSLRAHKELLVAYFGILNSVGSSSEASVTVNTISASPVTIITEKNKELVPFAATIALKPDGTMKVMTLSQQDNSFLLTVTPDKDKFRLSADATDWTLPYGPPIRFERLNAEGIVDSDRVRISQLSARMYGGRLKGKGELAWKDQWLIKGKGHASGVKIRPLLKTVGKKILSGRFKGNGSITLASKDPLRLLETPRLNAKFRFTDGVIYNADLERATSITGKRTKGGKTPFESLSGNIVMHKGHTTISKLAIVSNVIEARGKLKVKPDNKLNGELDVGLKKSSQIMSIPLAVSGTVEEPKIRPTREAMVGGAVGTAVLGPGVGTALGIRIGRFFKTISEKIGEENKKNKNKTVWEDEQEEEY